MLQVELIVHIVVFFASTKVRYGPNATWETDGGEILSLYGHFFPTTVSAGDGGYFGRRRAAGLTPTEEYRPPPAVRLRGEDTIGAMVRDNMQDALLPSQLGKMVL